MKLEIEIPELFLKDFDKDNFNDYFSRVLCDIKDGVLCGKYEEETTVMFQKAFKESQLIKDNSKAYYIRYKLDTGKSYLHDEAVVIAADEEAAVVRLKFAVGKKDLFYHVVEVYSVEEFTGGVFTHAYGPLP